MHTILMIIFEKIKIVQKVQTYKTYKKRVLALITNTRLNKI